MLLFLMLMSCVVAPKAFFLINSEIPEDVDMAISQQENRLESLASRYGDESRLFYRATWNYGLMLMRTDPVQSDVVLKQYFEKTGYSIPELEIVMDGFNFIHRPDLNQHYIDQMVLECVELYGDTDLETQFFRLVQANNLASILHLEQSEKVFLNLLEYLEEPEHVELRALVQFYYASMLTDAGRGEESIQRTNEALHLIRNSEDSEIYLEVQNLLCIQFNNLGQFETADIICNKVVEETRVGFGEDSYEYVMALNSLGYSYLERGLSEKSIPYFEQAIQRNHPGLFEFKESHRTLKHNLATALIEIERYDEAEEILLALIERTPQDAFTSIFFDPTLLSYTILLLKQDRVEEAHLQLQHHIAYVDKYFPNDQENRNIAAGYEGEIFHKTGQLSKAEMQYRLVYQFFSQKFSLGHPKVHISLEHLLRIGIASHHIPKTLESMMKLEASDRELLYQNIDGAEHIKEEIGRYLRQTSHLFAVAAFDAFPTEKEILQVSLLHQMNRKGIVQEVLHDQFQQLRNSSDPILKSNFQELQRLKMLESKIVQNEQSEYTDVNLTEIRDRIVELDRTIQSSFSLEDGIQSIDEVLEALPDNSIMIEFVLYTSYDTEKDSFGAQRVGAYTISKREGINGQSLTDFENIEKHLKVFRQTRSATFGKRLYADLIAPILPNPDEYDHVFIAADGALNLIPFELLQDADGEMLLDKTNVSYLSTGRDLIRLQNDQSTDLSEPFVLANPTYASKDNQVSLPATQNEADFLKRLYPESTVITKEQATVDTLRNVDSPKFIHIATHGFFDDDNPDTVLDNNPMTRSGLILAGSDDEEGVTRMLASEAVTLDLDGTELVVLSACESGLGKAENGEGVYGLRRAFALAGAQSQVVSLWSVDDDATAYFMESFYTKLKEGKGKTEAMKETKLEMRSIEQWENPKYWAAFVLTGDWR